MHGTQVVEKNWIMTGMPEERNASSSIDETNRGSTSTLSGAASS